MTCIQKGLKSQSWGMVEKIYMIYTDIAVRKKKGRRDCTFKFAHDHVIEKDALEEKKIERDMLTLEQNIWTITKFPKVT